MDDINIIVERVVNVKLHNSDLINYRNCKFEKYIDYKNKQYFKVISDDEREEFIMLVCIDQIEYIYYSFNIRNIEQ